MKLKKGSIVDYFFFLAIFLVIAMSAILGIYIYDEITPSLIKIFGPGPATTNLHATRQAFNAMDFVFLFLYVIFMAIPIVSAIFVKNHPIFMVINIIVLIIYIVVTPAISNAMRKFWEQPQLAEYSAGGSKETTFPIMTRIFQFLPVISFLISILLMLAQFGKGGGV